MKHIVIVITILLSLVMTTKTFAAERNFDGKIGTAYATDQDKFGINLTLDYTWVLDPYFAAGFESGLYWMKWEQNRGEELVGDANADIKAKTNAFVIPMLGIAQIRLPNLKEKIGVLPYASIGLGLSVMPIHYSDPGYFDGTTNHESKKLTQVYTGFTWQIMFGAAYSPSGSKIDFIAETGYVRAILERKNNEINMSRFVLNIGARFPIDKM